jgi:transposase InsO family protein
MLVVGMALVFCFLFYISQFASAVSGLFVSRRVTGFHGRRKWEVSEPPVYRFAKKPDWVPQEIIRMKALMPHSGCRTLAASFNRRFAHKAVSVGRTYVNETIRKHEYEIRGLRKKLKHSKPRVVPVNRVWAMDLTGKQDTGGKTHNILGLVEHGSRANLCLHGLRDKASITLLRHLLDAIEKYGKPQFLRTDNEAIFTSRLFRFGLWLLGIRHQRTDKGCPWMNGRIERLFGTLKGKLRLWEVDSLEQLNGALGQFRFWYNHVRPHQNLDGRTPAEIWSGEDIYTAKPKKELWFEAWDGLLTGYYLRL